MGESQAPAVTGIHHFSITVTDIEASIVWYQRLLGADRIPVKFPHFGCEDTGYGELLVEPRSGVIIGLHTNTGNDGRPFEEARTGLDHIALNVANRRDLQAWIDWLEELGIEHSGIREGQVPFEFATVVFRDPDNIQLELFVSG
ncbi:MAG: VOC family protein [Mycobacterium sp.]